MCFYVLQHVISTFTRTYLEASSLNTFFEFDTYRNQILFFFFKTTQLQHGSTVLIFSIKQTNRPKNEMKTRKTLISLNGVSELPPWSRLKTVAGNAEGRLVARKHFI